MVNKQGSAMTGIFWSAPTGIMVRYTGLRFAVSLLNTRQSRFRFRLLTVARSQPSRDILLVTLREGDDQAQSGELPEGDDNCAWPPQRAQKTLKPRLCWTIMEGSGIDTTLGTEHTEWVEPEAFRGSIGPFASHREDAAKAVS